MSRRHTVVALFAVVALTTALTGCQTARVGARCRGTGFAQTATHVLRCTNGRWRILMTKAQAIQLLVAIRNNTTTSTTTTTAPVTTTTAPTPPPPYALGPGYEHTCAVFAGTVKCVGRNQYGQLGDGTNNDSTTWVPTGITNALAVESGAGASCALRQNRTVWCWGYGIGGNLGNGASSNSSTPVQVSGISTATRLSVSPNGACVVLADATVRCWGHGWLRGDGTGSDTSTPVTPSITGVSHIAVGGFHACAGKADGSVWCWGKNDHGQLGDGTTTDSTSPVAVSGLSGTAGVAAGGFSGTSCAVLGSGGVSCWGADSYFQLGDGDGATTDRLGPNPVVGLTDARQVRLSFYAACALRSGGGVSCWGLGSFLGNGSSSNTSTPIAVSGVTTARSVSSGALAFCSVLPGDAGTCWGNNDYGQLGDGTTNSTLSPVGVVGMP